MIPISHPLIEDEEKAAVLAVLGSGQLAHGPRVREFEERFAEFVGAAHAVAVTSGTSSLHLALLAHGIAPGDEVRVDVDRAGRIVLTPAAAVPDRRAVIAETSGSLAGIYEPGGLERLRGEWR